jgi:hypothetical protein
MNVRICVSGRLIKVCMKVTSRELRHSAAAGAQGARAKAWPLSAARGG